MKFNFVARTSAVTNGQFPFELVGEVKDKETCWRFFQARRQRLLGKSDQLSARVVLNTVRGQPSEKKAILHLIRVRDNGQKRTIPVIRRPIIRLP